jgi:hypothetical protein
MNGVYVNKYLLIIWRTYKTAQAEPDRAEPRQTAQAEPDRSLLRQGTEVRYSLRSYFISSLRSHLDE